MSALLQNLTRLIHPGVPSQDINQRPAAHRHQYHPGITDKANHAKRLIANTDGSPR